LKWGDFRQSDNVEDRSGQGGDAGGGGGGFGGGGIRLGGGAIVVVVIASLLFGVNPLEMLGMLEGGGGPMPSQSAPPPGYGPAPVPPGYGPAPPGARPSPAPPGYGPQTAPPGYGPPAAPRAPPSASASRDPTKEMVARVLGDTEDVWGEIFHGLNARYPPPKLILYRGSTRSACGRAVAAVGPFYCSADREVYLDTAFFNELDRKFGAPGDFAQAYVIAHEVGHHVQNMLGTMQKFDAQSQRLDARGRNALSVRLELQADCYAGVWGHSAAKRNLLDPGDLEEGLKAAAAVGDDKIQKQMQGTVVPESFTHGSSAQRTRWFRIGFDTGDIRNCDTFSTRQL
jgi:predicted metalloprotease